MANYTPIILLITVIMLNYVLIYKKNRIVSGILFLAIGAGAYYLALINDLSTNTGQSLAMTSLLIVIITIISLAYDLTKETDRYTVMPREILRR